jgi:hypothetical protein
MRAGLASLMEVVVRVREKRREGVEPAQRQERLLGDLKATDLER